VIDGKIVDEQVLRPLRTTHKDSPEAQVIIQADTGVQHGKVVEVMEVAKAIGIDRLADRHHAGGSSAANFSNRPRSRDDSGTRYWNALSFR